MAFRSNGDGSMTLTLRQEGARLVVELRRPGELLVRPIASGDISINTHTAFSCPAHCHHSQVSLKTAATRSRIMVQKCFSDTSSSQTRV